MVATFDSLDALGCPDEIRVDAGNSNLARVLSTHRSGLSAHNGLRELQLTLGRYWYRLPAIDRPAIGDWITVDAKETRVDQIIPRRSLLSRVGAGAHAGQLVEEQAIAANIDWLVIVSSCNEEFNPSRLERYLAIATNAGIRAAVQEHLQRSLRTAARGSGAGLSGWRFEFLFPLLRAPSSSWWASKLGSWLAGSHGRPQGQTYPALETSGL